MPYPHQCDPHESMEDVYERAAHEARDQRRQEREAKCWEVTEWQLEDRKKTKEKNNGQIGT